jgi:hypothetical protein
MQTPFIAGPLAKIQVGLTTYSASLFASNKTQLDKKNFRCLTAFIATRNWYLDNSVSLDKFSNFDNSWCQPHNLASAQIKNWLPTLLFIIIRYTLTNTLYSITSVPRYTTQPIFYANPDTLRMDIVKCTTRQFPGICKAVLLLTLFIKFST